MRDKNLEDIYKRYANDVYRFSIFKLGSKEEAEDVMGETFTRLIESYDPKTNPNIKAWLITVARNIIYNKYKKEKEVNLAQDEEGNYQEFEDTKVDIEDSAVNSELVELLKIELEKIDEVTREVIVLKVWEELKFNEIAEIMKINESTAKLKFYRGIEKLKLNLQTEEKTMKLRSVTLPILLLGVAKIALDPAYRIDASFLSGLSTTLFGINIFNTITTTSMNATMASSAVKGGILSTTAAKVALAVVGTAAIAGIGVLGIANAINTNNQKPAPVVQPEQKPDTQKPDCVVKTYSNKSFPDFAFKYDDCVWDLSDKVISKDKNNYKETLELKSKEGTLAFDLEVIYGVGFGGPTQCYTASYTKLADNLWRIKNDKQFGPTTDSAFIYTSKVTKGSVNNKVCLTPGPNFETKNTINKDSDFSLLKVGIDSNKQNMITEADKVMKTMKWEKDSTELSSLIDSKFPNFSLNYDKKIWNVSYKDLPNSNPKTYIYNLTYKNAGLEVRFTLISKKDYESKKWTNMSCGTNDIPTENIGNFSRTFLKEYASLPGSPSLAAYIYSLIVYSKGDTKWNEYIDHNQKDAYVYDSCTFIFPSNLTFTTETTYTKDSNEYVAGITINLIGNNIDQSIVNEADKIVKSLKI